MSILPNEYSPDKGYSNITNLTVNLDQKLIEKLYE
jgi:hypothetical protein